MAITTPYKSSTVSSSSGTTFISSGAIFASGDVGRLIVLTSGSGQLQHRKITGFTNSTTVTLDHSFDTTPWLDTVSDVNPSGGDSFVVSYLRADTAFTGEAGVTVSGEQVTITALTVYGGAYVHLTNSQIDMLSDAVEIGQGGGIVCGWYKYISGEDAEVRDSCHIIDGSTAGTGGNQLARGTGADFGMFDIYGGVVHISASAVFWRCYGDPSLCQVRWINILCHGGFGLGSRTAGYRSIVLATTVGSSNTTGLSNPRSSVSRVAISAIDCIQAGYVFLDVSGGGPSGRLVFPRLNNISSRIIRCVTTGHSGTNVMEVIAKKSEVDAVGTFIDVSGGTPAGSHTFRYGNIVKPSFYDTSAVLVTTENIKTALVDNTLANVNNPTVTNGVYPDYFARHTDIPTTDGPKTLASGTAFGPYSLRLCAFSKNILVQSLSIEDTFDAPLTMIDDATLTETNKATVDAYSQINSAEKLYDIAKSYLFDNYTSQTSTYVSRLLSTIDAGAYDVVFDATAISLFNVSGSTMTIKSSVYSDAITTTGTVTAANGADISLASITSSSGSNTKIIVENLDASNIQILDNLGNVYDYQTGLSGTYTITTPVGASGSWKVTVKRVGYASTTTTITADGSTKTINGSLVQLLQPSGSAMYTASSSSYLTAVPNPDGSRLNLRIGNGTVTAQHIFDECEDSLVTSDGMKYLANGGGRVEIASLPTGTFLFMKQNVRLIRDSAGDSSATVEAFVSSSQGVILDNSNGDVQFVTVTRAQQLVEYGGFVFVDIDNGSNASSYPYGTQANPVNSWANAKTLCEFYGLHAVKFTGTMLHTSDAIGYWIEGSDAGGIIVLQGHDISKSTFRNLIMTGDAGNPAQGTQLRESYADSITNWNGVMDSVIFTGSVTVTGERNYITRSSSAVVDDAVVVLNVNKAGQCTTSIRDWYGRLTIGGVSNVLNTVSIDSDSGDIEILNTCTAGTITIRGEVTTFVDNSAGTTVNTAFVATKADVDSVTSALVGKPTLAQIEASTVLAKEATVNTRASQTSVNAIPTNPLLTNDARLDNLDATISSRLASASYTAPDNASVTAIKAKTDLLTFTGTDINATLDGEQVATTTADKNALVDLVYDEPYADHTTAGTFGKLFDIIRKSNLAVDGTVTANATTTSFDTDLAEPSGTHDHQVLLFVSGALQNLSRPILSFTNGASNTITLQEALPSAPSVNDEFVILSQHVHPISEIQAGLDTKTNVKPSISL